MVPTGIPGEILPMKIMSIHSWLRSVGYRLGQVREQLGFVALLSEEDYKEVAGLLPTPAALSLFRTMSPADQQHSLRVCRRLKTRGCSDLDMLAAALLHDVGKAEGRVPFWTRPAIVLGKKLAPQLLARLVAYPNIDGAPTFIASTSRSTINKWNAPLTKWRLALSYAWYHADIGADLALTAGLSERAVLYIRTHHRSDGPAAELHEVDEVS
jgi:hypothetical protein